MNGFFKFLKACEVINWLLIKTFMLLFKIAIMAPIWVIGFVIYQVIY